MKPRIGLPVRAAIAAALTAMLACSSVATDEDPARAVDEMLVEGDSSRAVHYLERVDKDARDVPDLHILLGDLYRRRGSIDGRLRSQHVLERARQLFPDDPGVILALGKTYYAQGFFPDAERCFREVLRLDPANCEARYHLGCYYYDRWRRVNAHTDELARARRYLLPVTECDPENYDAVRRYVYSLYVLEEFELLALECEHFLERFPDAPELYLMRGALAYDDERYGDAREQFARGIGLMSENDVAAYESTDLIFSYRARDMHDALQAAERTIAEREYWIGSDPDPTTEVNERHLEHVYRVFLSDVFFSIARPETRGWDTERGETFIRFGWPLAIQSSIGDSWSDGRQETWNYVIGGRFHQFLFVDERLNGNLRIPYADDLKLSFMRHSMRETDYIDPSIAVPGDIDMVTFRDDEMASTVVVSMRVDADSMRNAVDLSAIGHFHLRGVLFDDEWVAERRFADTLRTKDVPTVFRNGRTAFDLVREVRMPFDYYHFAASFEDEQRVGRAQLRASGDAYRYTSGGVVLSDVLLMDPSATGTPVRRRGRTLFPNPGHVYRFGERLPAYFEVYGLAVVSGRSSYTVSYAIYDAPEEEPSTWIRWGRRALGAIGAAGSDAYVSQSFQRSGGEHEAAEEIRVNIDSLDDGRYRFVARITDRHTGESAEASVVFEKIADGLSARR